MKFYLIIIGFLGLFFLNGCSSSQCMQENSRKEVNSCPSQKVLKATSAQAGVFCGDREVSDDF